MKLNTTQRVIIIVGCLLLVACVLFPPWVYSKNNLTSGYAFLLLGPSIHSNWIDSRVNVDLLRTQIAVVVLATAALVIATKGRC